MTSKVHSDILRTWIPTKSTTSSSVRPSIEPIGSLRVSLKLHLQLSGTDITLYMPTYTLYESG